jgi:arylsulfatase A-like enzyme
VDLKGFGRVFPHPFGESDDKLFNTKILISPVGDKLLGDFAKELIKAEKIGVDDNPDYLSISFSAVDAVNHFFGPSSRENEDVVLQLDRIIADLITFVEDSIGLEHTLIILSADHGMAEMPEYLTELGYKVGRLSPDEIVNVANETGQEKLGIDEIVRFFFRPYIYLNKEKIDAAKINIGVAEKIIASALTNIRGVAYAIPRSGLSVLLESPVFEQVRRNTHESRSGDIYVAQAPYWFLFDKGPVAVMHGSPWKYDTHVPLIFAGPSIPPQTINRLVHPVDVAPTIAAFLGMSPPSSTAGELLHEILR